MNNRQISVPEATNINQLPGNRYSSPSNSQDKNSSYTKKSDDTTESIDKNKLCNNIDPSNPNKDLNASQGSSQNSGLAQLLI